MPKVSSYNPKTGKTTVSWKSTRSLRRSAGVDQQEFVSKDTSKSHFGETVIQTPSGKVAAADPSVEISADMKAADILGRSRGLAKTYGGDVLDIQRQVSQGVVDMPSAQAGTPESKGFNYHTTRSVAGNLRSLPGGGVTTVMGIPGALDSLKLTEEEKKKDFLPSPTTSLLYVQPKVKPVATPGFSERGSKGIKEPLFTTLYKKGAKSITVNEPESFAKFDWERQKKPSLLKSVFVPGAGAPSYKQFDIMTGGILPGGVSEEFAQSVSTKQKMLASPTELKVIKGRDIYLKSLAIGGMVMGGVTAVSLFGGSAVTGLKGLITHKGATAALGSAGILGAVGYGSHETFIKQEQLTRTRTQKQLSKQYSAELEQAVEAGKQSIKGVDFRFSDPNLIKNVGQFINKGGTREEAFGFGARESLKETTGLTGGKLEELTALAQRKQAANIIGTIASTVTIGAGSETAGRIGLRKVKQHIGTVAARKIGRLGFGEAVAMNVVSTKAGHTDLSLINNPITWGIGGTATAAGIGGKIAVLGKGVKGKATLGGAYLADTGEAFGDMAADVGSFVFKGSKRVAGIRSPVKTITSIPQMFEETGKFRKKRKGQSSFVDGVTPSSMSSQKISPLTTSYTPLARTSTNMDIVLNVPASRTKTLIKSRGGESRAIVPPTYTPTTAPTAVDIPIRTPTPTIVDVPAIVDVPVDVPVPPYVPSTPFVNVPNVVNIPATVTVPTFKVPFFFIPGGGGSGRRFPRLFGAGKVKSKYAPSLAAKIYKIKAKKKPGIITGLGVRPLLGAV